VSRTNLPPNRRRRPRGTRAALAWIALLVVADSLAVYQLKFRDHGTPSFTRGGTFIAVGTAGYPVPYGAADDQTAATVASTTTMSVPPQPITGISVPRRPTTSTTTAQAQSTSSTSSTQPGRSVDPLTTGLPAPGTYTYAVQGSESASLFGSRAFPAKMTLVVHPSADLPESSTVADYTFSQDHQERQVLSRTDNGLTFSFEGGSVTFGPGTQTSQSDYVPPMVQTPGALAAGTTAHGTTTAVDPASRAVSRVEDWTTTVIGQETISIGGTPVDTWVVDVHRQSRPGATDNVTRDRRYWYDPSRALWVRWHESFHGSRQTLGLTFSYTDDYTATLERLP
jgi:hypothetical protein